MAIAVNAFESQSYITVLSESAASALASQFYAEVVYNLPSDFAFNSQFFITTLQESTPDANASQIYAVVVYRGHVTDPQLRVWNFTLDGHDIVAYQLGDRETLLYDLYSKRWMNWGTGENQRWRSKVGCNWSGVVGISPATQIVTGDEDIGVLYFLDPEYPYDDNPTTGPVDAATFHRIVQGQVPHRRRTPLDCFGVTLTGSFGDVYALSLTAVDLSYSDDAGHSYVDAGTISVDPMDYAARVEWPSLGLIYAPGRLFKIEDDGALARIDSLDMFDAGS